MDINEKLLCPNCKGNKFEVKREATFLYTYKLNTPLTNEWSPEHEALPFLFDNREQIDNREYIECTSCKKRYSCSLDEPGSKIHLTILQKAIRADFENSPEFLG